MSSFTIIIYSLNKVSRSLVVFRCVQEKWKTTVSMRQTDKAMRERRQEEKGGGTLYSEAWN